MCWKVRRWLNGSGMPRCPKQSGLHSAHGEEPFTVKPRHVERFLLSVCSERAVALDTGFRRGLSNACH